MTQKESDGRSRPSFQGERRRVCQSAKRHACNIDEAAKKWRWEGGGAKRKLQQSWGIKTPTSSGAGTTSYVEVAGSSIYQIREWSDPFCLSFPFHSKVLAITFLNFCSFGRKKTIWPWRCIHSFHSRYSVIKTQHLCCLLTFFPFNDSVAGSASFNNNVICKVDY